MTEIFVDADACPVKGEVVRVAERHRIVVHMVANAWMRLDDSVVIRRVVVAEGADAADDWIADRVGPRDIVVTADIPLAARCLERGAVVIGSAGKPFTAGSIGMALAMRELTREVRETTRSETRHAAFDRQDRIRFLDALEAAVQRLKRSAG